MVTVLQQAVSDLVGGTSSVTSSLISIFMLIGTVVCKFFLFLFCTKYPTKSTAVAALAQDHLNDVFTNTVSVIGLCLASYMPSIWFADPVAAILLSLYIIYSWGETVREITELMVGVTAPQDFLKLVTTLAFNHSPTVVKVDTVKAYHFGSKVITL